MPDAARSGPAIAASALAKTFGRGANAARALAGLTLEIPRGGIYGILGHNGAGKSTFFRICLDLIRPDSGDIRVLGLRPGDPDLFARVGTMIESPNYYPFLTARQTLTMLGGLSAADRNDVDPWLNRVGLQHAADRAVRGFSTGMKQRLGIAAAFLTQPELVILDEPTSGLDPAGIVEMRMLLKSLSEEHDVTIVIATHQLDEVRRLCDRVAVIAKGSLVREGRLDDLLAAKGRLKLKAAPAERVLAIFGLRAERAGDAVMVDLPEHDVPAAIRALTEAGVDIFEARRSDEDLEQLFLTWTAR